jgi:type VI secretion system secreted protein VgrG
MAAKVEFKLLGEGLPPDATPGSFVSREELSAPYRIEVLFSTADEGFEPGACLRKSLTLHLVDTDRGRDRWLSGICEACELLHHDGTRFQYRVVLVPPLAALAHREDCRIYQDKSVIDIVKEVLTAAGVDKVDYRLRAAYPPREYVVQYRESELDFVHRLLEDEGIFYFFEHEGGETTMVVTDSTEAVSAELKVPVVFAMSQGVLGTDPLSDFSFTRRLRTSSVVLRDFDFEKPQFHPSAEQPAESAYASPYYEYPGGFIAAADGQRRAQGRIRELRRDAETVRGTSGAPTLEVGKLIAVTGAAQEPLNGKFFVTQLVSRGTQSLSGDRGGEKGATNALENEFFGVPEGAPFAPPRRTKKPRIHGIQTAVVTGPTMGEEDIHCDNYGRIKVRFHWDRVGQFDDKSSCWIRVMQVPLGGSMIIPRAGWEVAVAFLDGDPDRPVVVGRVYNAERVPPYGLPGAKTSGAIKSASSPGGAGFNEINLGDSGGKQGFNVTAQKDLNVTVGHDQNETVGVNDTTIVKVNASHSVGANQAVTVGGNQETNVGSANTANVGGNLSISVGGNETDNATANYLEKAGSDRSESVGGNKLVICNGIEHTIASNLTREVGAVQLSASIASLTTGVGGNVTEKVGVAKIDLCKGPWAETVSGNQMAQFAAAELDIAKASYATGSGAATTTMVGGLRYAKVAGDFCVTAPMITLIGATGSLKGGGSELKLGGGPVVIKGSKVAIETALLVKLGGSLKMGS